MQNSEKIMYEMFRNHIGENGSYLIKKWSQKDDSYNHTHSNRIIDILNNYKKENDLAEQEINYLDYGCGGGIDLYNLANSNVNLYGFEVDKMMIKLAKETCKEKNVSVNIIDISNQNKITEYHNYFDIINSCDVLEHVDNVKSYLENCFKLLKTNGLILLNTPNPLSLDNIKSDPHYDLFGVTLMPQKFADYYITKLRKIMKMNEVTNWTYTLTTLNKKIESSGLFVISDNYDEIKDNIEKKFGFLHHFFPKKLLISLRHNTFKVLAKKVSPIDSHGT